MIDLGSTQYLDMDQNPVVGSYHPATVCLQILVNNGAAPLTLLGINPRTA
jgi:hypothetical protein